MKLSFHRMPGIFPGITNKIHFMGFPVAEVIGAAATIGTGAVNMGSASKTNLRTRQHNEHMFRWATDVNRENWRMQNEYNSPKAVMARYKEAGLNPMLVYGQGNTGANAQSIDQGSTGSYSPHVPTMDPDAVGGALANYYKINTMRLQKSILQQNLENEKRQAQLIEANATLARANAERAGEEATGQRIHNAQAGGLLNLTDADGNPLYQSKALAEYSSTASAARLAAGEVKNQPTRLQQENALRVANTDHVQAMTRQVNQIIEQNKQSFPIHIRQMWADYWNALKHGSLLDAEQISKSLEQQMMREELIDKEHKEFLGLIKGLIPNFFLPLSSRPGTVDPGKYNGPWKKKR